MSPLEIDEGIRWERCTMGMAKPALRSARTGQRLTGHYPGNCAQNTSESDVRDSLAKQVHGLIEVSLPIGRADVATETDVFEVEPFRSWGAGIQQVLSYAAQTGMRPNIALFGDSSKDDRLRIFKKLRDKLGYTATGFPCRLWIHQPSGWWEQITSAKAAGRVPR